MNFLSVCVSAYVTVGDGLIITGNGFERLAKHPAT